MSLVHYNNGSSFARDFDRFFDAFMQPWHGAETGATFRPRVDIVERENSYELHAELPGLKKEDIAVEVHDGELVISGERSFKKEEKGENFTRVESRYGKFYRSFQLPSDVDLTKIDAKSDAGILTITLPKTAESKPRSIKVL